MKKACKRGGKLLLIALFILGTLQMDMVVPDAKAVTQRSAMRYDREGDAHYDLLSALQKSIRGSDPDAAIHYLARLLEAGDLLSPCRRLLVIAAEAMSKLVDWQDRSTCVLFGDGAGAVVLTEGEDLLSIKLSANGDTDVMAIPNVAGNFPDAAGGADPYLTMKGQEVFKFAVSSMCRDIAEVIGEAGLSKDDISYVLPHQANMRIIDAARSRLKIAPERILTNIERFGNTASASIPLLLDQMNREGRFQKGDILALSAFGSGFTTGACILRWSRGRSFAPRYQMACD